MRLLITSFSLFLITSCAIPKLPTRAPHPLALEGAALYLENGDAQGAVAVLNEGAGKTKSPHVSFLLADILDASGEPESALSHYFDVILAVHENGGASLEATAAAMGIVAIRDRVPKFSDRLFSLFDRIGSTAGKLPLEAWYQLQNLRHSLERRVSNEPVSKDALRDVGCVAEWEAAGPIGPYGWRAFDDAKPPSPGKTWPVTVDLGQGRGETLFRKVDASSCFTSLQNPELSLPGLTWARTGFFLEKPAKVFFRLQTMEGAVVFAGTEELHRKDPRMGWPSRVEWFTAEMPAGTIEISVAVASNKLPPSFSLVVLDEAGFPPWLTEESSASLPVGVSGRATGASPMTIPDDILGRYAALKIALWWDDIELAFGLIDTFKSSKKSSLSPAILARLAEAEMADPSQPRDVAYEKARAIEVKALGGNSHLWQVRINLAERAFSDGRTLEAVSSLEDGILLTPKEPELLRRLLNIYAAEGWHGESQNTLDQLTQLMPESCNTLGWRLALARRTNKFEAARDIASKLQQCDASSPALAEEWLRAQRFDDALKERERLARRDPFAAASIIETIRTGLAGDMDNEVVATTQKALAKFKGETSIRLLLADLYGAEGDTKTALRILQEGAAIPHAPKLSISSAEASLEQKPLFPSLRVDGGEIIDDYIAQELNYDTASVFVLDRAVFIVGHFGEITCVVHTITHLQTDEAIEENGELALPAGAILLNAQTIKKDGRILKPERISGKSTLSLPGLEAGDFIESEYVLHFPPSQIYAGGFDTERFYFQDFDNAFHRSEIILSVERGTEIQTDPRGDCPKASRRVEGDREFYAWRVNGVLPSPTEPLAPIPSEYLPSIRISARVTWDRVMNRMTDLLADQYRPSRHIEFARKAATANRKSDERLLGIYEFVLKEIEHGENYFEQASHIIARKSGHRARVFHALATAAGIHTRLALVKPNGFDEKESLAHDYVNFNTLLVEVPGEAWIGFDEANAPLGYIPPRLRHRPLRYLDDGSLSKTDGGRIPTDDQKVDLSLVVDPDGSVRGTVRERLVGSLANNWRSEFSVLPEEEWERRFEQGYLSSAIPGAELLSLDVINLTTPNKPIVLVYRFRLENFVRREGSALSASIPYPINLFKQIGGLPARRTPLILSSWIKKDLTVSVFAKDFDTVSLEPPTEDRVESEWGSASRWHEIESGTLRFGYRANLQADRIAQDRYKAFLDFASHVDRISEMEISLTN